MSKVQHHYAKYVTSGGDGPTVLKGRAATLGYDSDFVPETIYKNPNLFQASCGSGCPLKLAGRLLLSPSSSSSNNDNDDGDDDCFIILDIGCGAGHDVLLANELLLENNNNKDVRKQRKYKVIGIDLTPEMIDTAKQNANQTEHHQNVEFVVMNIEDPTTEFMLRYENQVDLVISNGVFNLCRNKLHTFRNIQRLLKPDVGRLVFSDVMKLPPQEVNPKATIATSINGDVFSS